ncbi:hypothetical protein EV178_000640 [Coemansia sp. RSA 1646]|nr:hypothetical protein EV178_000640 [Coemansia sp. RSA 1646]
MNYLGVLGLLVAVVAVVNALPSEANGAQAVEPECIEHENRRVGEESKSLIGISLSVGL